MTGTPSAKGPRHRSHRRGLQPGRQRHLAGTTLVQPPGRGRLVQQRDPDGRGGTVREESAFLNPGVRWAFDFESGLQIVPGLAYTIGLGPSDGDDALFLYLSLEHPSATVGPLPWAPNDRSVGNVSFDDARPRAPAACSSSASRSARRPAELRPSSPPSPSSAALPTSSTFAWATPCDSAPRPTPCVSSAIVGGDLRAAARSRRDRQGRAARPPPPAGSRPRCSARPTGGPLRRRARARCFGRQRRRRARAERVRLPGVSPPPRSPRSRPRPSSW